MKPSHRTQPYRKGQARQPGLAMKAMQKGRTGTGHNPMDLQRAIAKGGDAPRKVHSPVGPAKGVSRPAAPKPSKLGGLARKLNRTGNARDGGIYREVRGVSKSGERGTYHVYPGDRRVFVADEPKPRKPLKAKVAPPKGAGPATRRKNAGYGSG
jgi:hypothetical protein